MFIRVLRELADIMYQYKQKCNCYSGDRGNPSTVRNWGSICGSSEKFSSTPKFEAGCGTHPASSLIGTGMGVVGGGLISLQVKCLECEV
jgi:hypothetical protein